jgi:hypothetical protein
MSSDKLSIPEYYSLKIVDVANNSFFKVEVPGFSEYYYINTISVNMSRINETLNYESFEAPKKN